MSIQDLDSEELKARALNGDEEAVDELVRRGSRNESSASADAAHGPEQGTTAQTTKEKTEQASSNTTSPGNLEKWLKDMKISRSVLFAGISILLSLFKVPIIPLVLAVLAYKEEKGIIPIIALVLSVGVLLNILWLAMFTETSFFRILFNI